jgi:uncharacterized protein YbaR (Trm112 family)/SAM-dependent methyltransferase
MRYTLITFLACPMCLGELAATVATERPSKIPVRNRKPSPRVAPSGGVVAPLGPVGEPTAIRSLLERYASSPAPAARDYDVEVEYGLLICQSCVRWFPVTACLPELLPDHLRDRERDRRSFEDCIKGLPGDLVDQLRAGPTGTESSVVDGGVSYKRAEIGISAKVDDPNFFSPGYSSPFNPHNAEFTLYLIKLFGAAVPLLELKTGDTLIDSGCGYAWTTEWLYKSGVEAIGVDICRTYLEIGMQRMGENRPHLIVADVENLPVRSSVVDAVLAFESAHHIPDRKRAMVGFSRVLQPAGRMVLAEPGAAHEDAQISVDVMAKYGILEKGMELDDVRDYIAGTDMGKPEQIFLLRVSDGEVGSTIGRTFLGTHSVVEGNLFRIYRQQRALDALKTAWHNPRRVVWPKVKRRLRGALVRLGLE